jgi:hypothetical protein
VHCLGHGYAWGSSDGNKMQSSSFCPDIILNICIKKNVTLCCTASNFAQNHPLHVSIQNSSTSYPATDRRTWSMCTSALAETHLYLLSGPRNVKS